MGALTGLLALIVVPIGILNFFGGLIAVVWLVIVGEWHLVFKGFVALAIGSIGIPIAMIVTGPLGLLAARLIQQGYVASAIAVVVAANLWAAAIAIVWQVCSFFYFAPYGQGSLATPVWLLSYGVATAVFSWMASKDQQSGGTGMGGLHAFAAQLSYLLFSACVLWLHLPAITCIVVMSLPFLIPVVAGAVMVTAVRR